MIYSADLTELGDDDMNQTGSGGIGAVSVGIAEPLVWLLLLVVLILLALGAWKLFGWLWSIFG